MIILFTTVFIVLFASALCSGVEAALFSIPLLKARQLAENGKASSIALLEIRTSMNRPIAMIVILNNISNIVGSIIVGGLAAKTFGTEWLGLFSGILTFLVIVFAEIIPKTVGETHNEAIAKIVSRPVKFLTTLFTPIILLVEFLTKPLTNQTQSEISTNEREIRYLAKVGAKEGVIESHEYSMLNGVFQLNDRTARELMTPRIALTTLPGKSTLDDVKKDIIGSEHSRMIVIGHSSDIILGVALRSDLLTAMVNGAYDSTVESFSSPPLEVDQHTLADTILPQFQQQRQHLAIVRDEFGSVAGVITLEDIIEELTGEIVDETDRREDMRDLSV